MLTQGEIREVQTATMDRPEYVEAFTIPQAAKALGRSELCLKKWIADGIVPEPILQDTVRRYKQYSVGELTTIARVLREHESEFRYLTAKHTDTIHTMWQRMLAYRSTRV